MIPCLVTLATASFEQFEGHLPSRFRID
jgi:hypothetical protein